MAADKSYHYTVRLDIQHSYGTSAFPIEEDAQFMKSAFERRVRELNDRCGKSCSVVWIEEIKPPAPEPQSTIL